MPASPAAAGLTDGYRAGLLTVRGSVADQLATGWRALDLDQGHRQVSVQLDQWVDDGAAAVTTGQRAAVALTDAYLPAYLAASHADPALPSTPLTPVGVDAAGRPLTTALLVARAALLWRLGQHAGRSAALSLGLAYGIRVAATSVSDAGSHRLGTLISAHDDITGWRRVCSTHTCQRCASDAGRTHTSDVSVVRHPSCRCIAEPVVFDHSPLHRASPTVTRP